MLPPKSGLMALSVAFMRFSVLVLVLLCACFPRVGEAIVTDSGLLADAGDGSSCANGLLDGTETDVDCGGACTTHCPVSGHCASPIDCESGRCTSGVCAPTSANACGAFAGCVAFTDLTAPDADRTISFQGGNDRYTPKCIRVRFGQSVTFSGSSFSTHPLTQACGPSVDIQRVSSGSTTSVAFDQALGVYGYFCTAHGSSSGSGMAGAIEVVR